MNIVRLQASIILAALPVATHAEMQVVGYVVPPAVSGAYQTTLLSDLDGDGSLEIVDALQRVSENEPPWEQVTAGAARVSAFEPATASLRFRAVLIPGSGELVGIGAFPRGGGAQGLAVASADGVIATFAPDAQDPLARHRLGRTLEAARFADADGDGATEGIVVGPGGVSAHGLATGVTLWSRQTGSRRLDVGQLDGDPALEIVLEGRVGYVIDGATSAVDWQYAGGFGNAVAVGRIGPGGAPGFVTGFALTGFRSVPYSPLWTVKTPVDQLDTYNINGDQVDEVVAGNASSTTIYDAGSQAILHELGPGTRNVALGDVDGDGAVEAVGYTLTGVGPGLGVLELNRTVLAAEANEGGIFSRVSIADPDADGMPEGLVISGGDGEAGVLRAIDVVDGRERWRTTLAGIDPQNQPLMIRSQRIAQLDADAANEIVLAARSIFRTRLVVLDGATRQPQAVNASGGFDSFEFASHVEVLSTEPRVLTFSRRNGQIQLRRFTSNTLAAQGTLLVPAQYGDALYDVQVDDVDADGDEDVLLATSSHLVAFDLEAGTVIWAASGAAAAVAEAEVAPSVYRLARLSPSGTLALLTFEGVLDSTPVSVGARASAVVAVPGVPGEVFVCADDRVKRVALDDGEVLDQSPGLGAQACRGGDLAASTTSSAGSRVLAGSLVGAFLLEPSGERLFRDGFE
jgi:hypothetical protein